MSKLFDTIEFFIENFAGLTAFIVVITTTSILIAHCTKPKCGDTPKPSTEAFRIKNGEIWYTIDTLNHICLATGWGATGGYRPLPQVKCDQLIARYVPRNRGE